MIQLDEPTTRLAIYLQLMSHPLIVFGLLWLMIFRHDWRRRPTSLVYALMSALVVVLFIADVYRLMVGLPMAAAVWDLASTPILLALAGATWWGVVWLSRQWRHDPFHWLS